MHELVVDTHTRTCFLKVCLIGVSWFRISITASHHPHYIWSGCMVELVPSFFLNTIKYPFFFNCMDMAFWVRGRWHMDINQIGKKAERGVCSWDCPLGWFVFAPVLW